MNSDNGLNLKLFIKNENETTLETVRAAADRYNSLDKTNEREYYAADDVVNQICRAANHKGEYSITYKTYRLSKGILAFLKDRGFKVIVLSKSKGYRISW
jgi:hypothetical protein